MREHVEFRIPEEYAQRFLDPGEGKRLGTPVRALVVSTHDPLYERVGAAYRRVRQEGRHLYAGWSICREYSQQELATARLFHLKITSGFEPAGEECGTRYDYSGVCPHCGAGRQQTSDLILDLRKTPRSRDLARTIADEWIVSQRLAERLLDAAMTGFELRPVRHKARYQDDPIDVARYPSGQELLERAALADCAYPSWKFWVWLNRRVEPELWERVLAEHVRAMEGKAAARPRTDLPVWYQLVVTSPPVRIVEPTRFGERPFEESDKHRCPLGHVAGLNVLSELWVDMTSWDGSDIACTEQMTGLRSGLLVPAPHLLISPRLRKLLEAEKVKGYRVEVVHAG